MIDTLAAIDAGADLMVVHHGLFWGGSQPWTGKRYELLRLLLDYDLAANNGGWQWAASTGCDGPGPAASCWTCAWTVS